jgi:RHS repeat-associated protein
MSTVRGWRSRVLIGFRSGSGGRWSARLAAGLAVVVTATVAPALTTRRTAAAAPPVPVVAAPARVECPKDRPDVASAAVSAKLCGGRVEVSGLISETSQTWVNADGTLTSERHLGPVRVRQGDAWVPADFTLRRLPDGTVASKAHPRGLRLSGARLDAGEHDLVTVGVGDSAVSVAWAGRLPEPVLEGAKATYREVLPSVDLVVEATRTGYKQVFVVKDRAGLASVARIPLALKTGKLTAAADGRGGVAFKDASGATVGDSPALEMWDSTVDPGSQTQVNRAPVGLSLTARGAGVTEAVLTPDASFLARSDLRFPLMIDPPGRLDASFDAFVQTSFSSDQSGSTELRIGTYNGGGDVARSFLDFPTSGLWDTTVLAATLNVYEFYSWQCASTEWQAYRSPGVSSSLRWSNQPTPLAQVGSSWLTTGHDSACGGGTVGIDVRAAIQDAASAHSNTSTIMLRAASESSNTGWKKFNSSEQTWGDPFVSVTYNVAPVAPWGPTVAPCYSVCDFGARVSSAHPSLSAHQHDDNTGQDLRAEFEVRNAATQATVGSSGTLFGYTAGSVATWQVPATLVTDTAYEWRSRTWDPYTIGPWSGWIGFTVDTGPVGVPFVSSPTYLSDNAPHGGAGVQGTFTFAPATGMTDLGAYVYTLTNSSPTPLIATTTLPATGTVTVPITPSVDGNLTLTVKAKDRAGNESPPNVYTFKVGAAALAQPLPGANVVRRMKLSVDSAVAGYTRGFFEYRRGQGGSALAVPSANLTTASGAALTATNAQPATLANLGGYAVWSAADTLGSVGGVVEVRAQLFTDASTSPVFATPWIRVTVDPDADGAAGSSVGPGSVNLLTGDYGLSSTDTDDLGLNVSRAASSRRPSDGFVGQQELLTVNQQQVSSGTTGFDAGGLNCATLARATTLGQGDSTDSLEVTPTSSCGVANESYATVGGDTGIALGMTAGKTYRATAWIYVPAATGLSPGYTDRGLRIMAYYYASGWHEFASAKASYTDAWQQLSVDMPVGTGVTNVFFRLYNGNAAGSGKKVYWDNLFVKEIVAPFGPSWSGGATGGPAAAPYTTLEFPEPSLAVANLTGGGWITFSRDGDGVSYTPEPGSEGLVLSKPDSNTYRITDADGTISDFTKQGAAWTIASSRTTESSSTTRYVYDTTNARALVKKVINPVEPGVDDTNSCTATLVAGCEVLEYVYATATTSGLSQTVFGDYLDHVKQVKLWVSDPGTGVVSDTVVTEYRYDVDGELREVWDPRVSPALKTSYDYGLGGRVTKITPPGELPWQLNYGNPDVDAAALRWDLDPTTGTNAADSSGNSRDGVLTNGTWSHGQGAEPTDNAATFNGSSSSLTRAGGSGVATDQSFTVSAWVKTTDTATNNFRTAVSQDGGNVSGFYLQTTETNTWRFTRHAGDSPSQPVASAYSTDHITAGVWAHLTGVYNASTEQISLYVNGVLNDTSDCWCAWNATGPFAVGRGRFGGVDADWWLGSIDDVRIYPKVLTADQIANLAGDDNPGRLIRVERAALQQGSPTTTDGTIATNVVYHVPLTVPTGGPYNLDAATAATWGQTDYPTDATALFGPEDVPAVNSATQTTPGASGYPYATVSYLNPTGKEVNTATPGGHIDTTDYDKFGNTVRTLQATDREIALGTHPTSAQYLVDLGLTALSTSDRANALSTVSTYSTDGLDQLTTTGPTMRTVLEQGSADPDGTGPLAAIPAGTTVLARAHTVNIHDQNKPDGTNYHLLTTTTSGAAMTGYPDADARTTTKAYNAEKGGTSGWVLRKPTMVVADAGAGGTALTSYVVYDSTGRVTESWGVGSTGTDARTTKTIYYTAGTNAADAACGNTPKWAGNACVTKKAGAVTGHDAARMSTNLPERRVTAFTRWGDVSTVTETVPGTSASRTTTTLYDTAGRVSSVAITSTGDGATPLPTITTDYSASTGLVTATHAGTPTITREYDILGRLYRYTDADGGVTTNEFDRYGKPSKVTDPTGNATFAYNRALEPRGFLTSTTDSVAGTLNAEYSADGQLTVLHYPNGMTRTDTLDANLEPVARTYTRDTDNAVIYHDAVVANANGQAVNHTYTGGSRTYNYDRVGRLTATAETADGSGCTTRTYSFDSRTNRTSRKTYNPDVLGSCRVTGTSDAQADHTYDSADRTTDTGYTYDAFGRITAMPGGLTNTFYANDIVAGETLDTNKQNWALDPKNRFRSFTTASYDGTNWTTTASRVNHYSDDSDNPRWIIEDTATGALTRLVSGPDGTFAATTTAAGSPLFQVVNLHGDVVTTLDATLLPPAFNRFDEFGVPTVGQSQSRFGWLGGKQRSAEALGGVILMGVRVYHPDTGRFLQPDPVDGGSATAYDYCNADPVNTFDLAGTWPSWSSIKKAAAFVAPIAAIASVIPGPIGAAAAAVSAVSYAVSGQYLQAAMMAATAACAFVGAGGVGLALSSGARAASAAGKVATTASRVGSAVRSQSAIYGWGARSAFNSTRAIAGAATRTLAKAGKAVSIASKSRWYPAIAHASSWGTGGAKLGRVFGPKGAAVGYAGGAVVGFVRGWATRKFPASLGDWTHFH